MFRLWTQVTTSPLAVRPQSVGRLDDLGELGAAGREQRDDLVLADLLAGAHAGQHLGHRPPDDRAGTAGHERRRRVVRPRVPLRGAVPDQHDLGAVLHHVGRGHLLRPHRARIVTPHPFGVRPVHDSEPQVDIEPPVGLEGELGVDRQAGSKGEAPGLGDVAQPVELGPGPFGVHVVGGHRRDAAPVVDAGVEQHAEVVGEVGRGLHVDVGRQDQAGDRDRPEELVRRAGGGAGHGRAQLGQEVLDDHLLHVAVAAMAGGDGLQRLDAVPAGFADAAQDAGREGDGQLAGVLERGEAPLGRLVGRAPVAARGRG